MAYWFLGLLAVLSLATASVAVSNADVDKCTYTVGNGKASYDLSTMRLGSDTGFSVESQDTTYYFNICKNVKAPVKECEASEVAFAAYAVNHKTENVTCTPLGQLAKTEMEVLSVKRPSLGVSLKYSGGKICTDSTSGLDSTFTIRFHCAPDVEDAVPVVENNACNYALDIYTPLACPLECPLNSHKMCFDKGVCDFDTDISASRCFCNKGYYGADCSKNESDILTLPACDGTCAALAVVFVLLIAIFAAVCYMAYNMWRVGKRDLRVNNDERKDLMTTMF